MLEEGPSTCAQCGGSLRRMLYPAGIIFKGSGFYRTDSRKSTSSASGEGGSTSKPATSKPGTSDAGTASTSEAPKKD